MGSVLYGGRRRVLLGSGLTFLYLVGVTQLQLTGHSSVRYKDRACPTFSKGGDAYEPTEAQCP